MRLLAQAVPFTASPHLSRWFTCGECDMLKIHLRQLRHVHFTRNDHATTPSPGDPRVRWYLARCPRRRLATMAWPRSYRRLKGKRFAPRVADRWPAPDLAAAGLGYR